MLKVTTVLLTLSILVACISFHSKKTFSELPNESEKILKSNMEFLASDELEGREATTKGARVAAKFIASQLKLYGVKPFGDSSSYFQNFKLQKSYFLPSCNLILTTEKNDSLSFNKNFIPFRQGEPVNNSQLIYVKFGISDSINNYDDYAGLNVTGKTVLCFSGEPYRDNDPDYFKKSVTNWLSSNNKAKLAMEKGASGIIFLQNSYWMQNWDRLKSRYTNPVIEHLENNTGLNAAWIDSSLAKNLFSLEHLDYDQLLDTLKTDFIKPGLVLNPTVSWSLTKEIELVTARNVVGIIEGTDKSLVDEIVTIGAHYDHVGIQKGKIYNGADDNASGTVTVLESARQLASLKSNKRPIVFLLYSAEEKGLLGAEYFVNSISNLDNIIANINLDMVGRESADTMFVLASGRTSREFYNLVEEANAESAKFHLDYTYDDPNHPKRYYYRSDHWKFAQKNIPAVFFHDIHETDLHKPTDDAEKINYNKIAKAARLSSQLALKVANLDHRLSKDPK